MVPEAYSLTRFLPLIDGLTVLGVVTGTAKSFDWFDGLLSDKGRKAISQWLINAPEDASHDSWATVFPSLIDRVFGPRVLSIKFFFRSCVASALAVLIVSAIMYRGVLRIYDWDFEWQAIRQNLVTSIGSNMFPDFCSLVLSRAIVRAMEKRPKLRATALLLALDTALTGCIGVASANLGLVFTELLGASPSHITLKLLLGNLFEISFLGEEALRRAGMAGMLIISMRIFFFSAFFTSVWVWLYVVAGVLVKTMERSWLIWKNVSPFLDIERKPLAAMGRVAGLLAGAAYGLFLGWAKLFQH